MKDTFEMVILKDTSLKTSDFKGHFFIRAERDTHMHYSLSFSLSFKCYLLCLFVLVYYIKKKIKKPIKPNYLTLFNKNKV